VKKACIIGYPVKHSRSPLIHGHWLKKHGLEGSYGMEEVKPEDFADFIRAMPDRGYAGGNITIPHKTALLALAKHRTAGADAVGAANTLWFENGEPCVDNTDVPGFLASLDQDAPGWDRTGGIAMVLGAGGAGRGIVHGLKQRGFGRIVVANRTLSAAEALARDFGATVQPLLWREIERHLGNVDFLVNSTSLGMNGQPALELSLQALPETAVVTDAVYVPLETPLLLAAKARGLRTVGGLGMLLHQAVPGFERWFGLRPCVTPELTRLIEADVNAGH
jgi:shikimate dehydrogenase